MFNVEWLIAPAFNTTAENVLAATLSSRAAAGPEELRLPSLLSACSALFLLSHDARRAAFRQTAI